MKNKFTMKILLFCSITLLACWLPANQVLASEPVNVEVSGTVLDDRTGETLIGVNIVVKGTIRGVATDVDGRFTLNTRQELPLTLVFSSVGYRSQEVVITEANVTDLVVRMQEQSVFGSDVVVSASRVEQDVLSSPVSIEKMDAIAVRESAAPSFYDALANMKGVDFSSQSLTFRSVNTRGFNRNGNLRFVQLIDGIDNQAPGLNFPVGNVVGINDLDLESAELMPGVASALYGPNALNGILLLNSKSPFEYQGLSAYVKTGLTHVDGRDFDTSIYQDYAVRYANVVNNRFAYKFNFSYLRARDFYGVDMRDRGPATFGVVERGANSRNGNRVYDAVNKYGQPLLTIGQIADGQIAAGNQQVAAIRALLPDGELGAFTPTGYTESSFVDNTTESLKFGTALHYRLTDRYEVLGQFNWGSGSTVYTANDRFILDDFSIWTGKLELRNPNFFVRAYTTQENSGDTYAANTLASLINVRTFIPAYFQTFAGARVAGQTVEQAHASARVAGENAQFEPGSPGFIALSDSIRALPISEGGAKFLDKSALWHGEVMYNFSNVIDRDVVEIISGANVRRYALNSEGTLFALQDNGDEFSMDEFGVYTQLRKDLWDGRLSLQGSVRYDKNENFDGQFSPRISAVVNVFDTHNIRLSFQRGFRIPTTQDQFIDLDVVTRRLIGSNPVLIDRYRFRTNQVYDTESLNDARQILQGGGSAADARAALQPYQVRDFDTEKVSTFEIGYKSLINNRLFIDAYYYFSRYSDFIVTYDITQAIPNGLREDPGTFDPTSPEGQDAIINRTVATQRFGHYINTTGNVDAHGWAFGADYIISGGYTIGANVAFNELLSDRDLREQGFGSAYSTPKWRYNIQFRNRRVTENFGFNIVYRWQDAFLWESTFGDGIIEAFGTLDAQVSYNLPQIGTNIKFSASNILNERYTTSIGNPSMGSIYLLTLSFDQFMN